MGYDYDTSWISSQMLCTYANITCYYTATKSDFVFVCWSSSWCQWKAMFVIIAIPGRLNNLMKFTCSICHFFFRKKRSFRNSKHTKGLKKTPDAVLNQQTQPIWVCWFLIWIHSVFSKDHYFRIFIKQKNLTRRGYNHVVRLFRCTERRDEEQTMNKRYTHSNLCTTKEDIQQSCRQKVMVRGRCLSCLTRAKLCL